MSSVSRSCRFGIKFPVRISFESLFVAVQVDVKRSMDDGEKRFNQLSIEERGKFDEETLVNVNSIKRNKTGSQRSSGFSNEYIVVCTQMVPDFLCTILCAFCYWLPS
jgi:uncharacterized membrane protein